MTLAPKLGFLDLAAEIRNEIYAYLIEDVDTNVGRKIIQLRTRSEFSSYWRKKHTHRGDVYALNQVCRTTRCEFGPLYVSEIAHRIRVNKHLLPRFLHDFFLSDYAGSPFALKPRKIEIELAYPLGVSTQRINVLPLLSLIIGNDDLQCNFLGKFGPLPEVDTLFRDHAVAWGDAILDDLLEILLYTPDATTCIDLVFRDDGKQAFVSDITERRLAAPSSMHAYLKGLGRLDVRGAGLWNPQAHVQFFVSKRSP